MAETKINASACDSTIWTQNSLRAGKDISISFKTNPYVIDEYTLALWHFDSDFKDAVNNIEPFWTQNSLTESVYKFGSQSVTNNTSSWDREIQYNLSSLISSYGKDRTIDYWIYASSGNLAGTIRFPVANDSAGGVFSLSVGESNGDAIFTIQSSIVDGPSGKTKNMGAITSNTWHHICWEIDVTNSKVYAFLDGNKADWELNLTQQPDWSSYGWYCHGVHKYSYVDEIRISDIVRWDDDFEVPTEPYAASASESWYVINNTQNVLTTATGYDSTKTQVLKNVNGVLTWVTEA